MSDDGLGAWWLNDWRVAAVIWAALAYLLVTP